MDIKLKNKLQKIFVNIEKREKTLEKLLTDLKKDKTVLCAILTEVKETVSFPGEAKLSGEVLNNSITELKQNSREQTKKQLESMKKPQIELIFRQLGGSSAESKKRKVDVIKRILWYLFDFSSEHDSLLK